jgi:hypothetical protein
MADGMPGKSDRVSGPIGYAVLRRPGHRLAGPHPHAVIGSHLFEAGRGASSWLRSNHKRFTAERGTIATSGVTHSSEQSGLLALPHERVVEYCAPGASSEIAVSLPFSMLCRGWNASGAKCSSAAATALHDITGKTLGSYRVLEPLGRGGRPKSTRAIIRCSIATWRSSLAASGGTPLLRNVFSARRRRWRLRHHVSCRCDFGIHDGVTCMVMGSCGVRP